MHIYLKDKNIIFNLQQLGLLLQSVEKELVKSDSPLQEGLYKAYLHRSSGRLLFPELSGVGEVDEGSWKKCLICDHIDLKKFSIFFEVKEASGKEPLSEKGLSPQAFACLQKTIGVINREAELLQGPDSTLRVKIHILAHLQVEEEPSLEEMNPLQRSWHSLDRYDAERVLQDTPAGTYLLRRDRYTILLEKELGYRLKMPVTCITATYVGLDGGIHDLTWVHWNHQWKYYNDDPNLKGPSYDTLKEILKTFENLLKFPLPRAEWKKAA